MYDPRIAQVAHVLVDYSTRLRPGELVGIVGAPVAKPLLIELFREALRAGSHPHLLLMMPEANEILLREGSEEQIRFVSPLLEYIINHFDCRIMIFSDENTKALNSVDPGRQAIHAQAMQPVSERDMARLGDPTDPYRWVATLFPTNGYAQDAEMSLAEYTDFVFGACLPPFEKLPEDAKAFANPEADPADPVTFWQAFSRWQGEVVNYLNSKKQLHVVGPNIDLRLSVAGRTWWNADGHVNFPDGEVFTAPVEDSVEGWVAFTYPAVFRGTVVRDVRLRFEKGRVVEASAGHGEDFLLQMLDSDEGARRLGEFAIGTNPSITRFTGHTLFDEKIKGTCHMALGYTIPGTGGVNKSALHWDMVCDLRHDSRIYADEELLYENGEFVVQFASRATASGIGAGSMVGMFVR